MSKTEELIARHNTASHGGDSDILKLSEALRVAMKLIDYCTEANARWLRDYAKSIKESIERIAAA
jgi:hypothetical protein